MIYGSCPNSVDVRSQSQTNTVGVNGYISIPVDVRSQSTGRV